DNAMMKHILATHAPDGTYLDVIPLLHIIEDIMNRANPDPSHQGNQAELDAIVEGVIYNDVNEMLEVIALTINKVSCEVKV
nr:protein sieve element occlusion B-like [Tanacetum cinerariifolium]